MFERAIRWLRYRRFLTAEEERTIDEGMDAMTRWTCQECGKSFRRKFLEENSIMWCPECGSTETGVPWRPER